MLARFSYVRPTSLQAAVDHLSEEGAVVHAGGTDLLGCMREGVFAVRKVVSLSAVEGLKGIEETPDGGLRIGALATISQVASHPLVRQRFAALATGASEVASPQLRNQGTIGGNLCQKPRCWYYRGEFHCLRKGGPTCFAAHGQNQFHGIFGADGICFIVHPSDTAPALAALDASVSITGPGGRRSVPAAEFHVPPSRDVRRETVLEPGELVTDIRVPGTASGLISRYRKVRARRSWDFALAGAALALRLDGDRVLSGRVVLSGAAPVPWRCRAVEETITGARLDSGTIAEAARSAVRDAEPLEHNAYKLPLFQGVLEEELAAIAVKQKA